MITNASSAPSCALIPPLGCALSRIEQQDQTSVAATQAFSRLYGHTLDPALLVAQDHIVKGLRESFLSGVQAQTLHLDTARTVLAPPATWVLHPSLLDYLSRIPDLAVPPVEANGEAAHHTALRTLARLFFVLSTIDGESARIAAADRVRPKEERVRRAQERGVLTLIEAATVLGVLDSWAESAPLGVGTEFLGVLTPMDQGFRFARSGRAAFRGARGVRSLLVRSPCGEADELRTSVRFDPVAIDATIRRRDRVRGRDAGVRAESGCAGARARAGAAERRWPDFRYLRVGLQRRRDERRGLAGVRHERRPGRDPSRRRRARPGAPAGGREPHHRHA